MVLSDNRRDIMRSFRMNTPEYLELKSRAAIKGQSVSSLIHASLFGEDFVDLDFTDKKDVKSLLGKWLAEFNKHGAMLNLIAATYEKDKRDEIGLTAYFYSCGPLVDALSALLISNFRLVVSDKGNPP